MFLQSEFTFTKEHRHYTIMKLSKMSIHSVRDIYECKRPIQLKGDRATGRDGTGHRSTTLIDVV